MAVLYGNKTSVHPKLLLATDTQHTPDNSADDSQPTVLEQPKLQMMYKGMEQIYQEKQAENWNSEIRNYEENKWVDRGKEQNMERRELL